MSVHLRYCPACREEYQPHMVRCIECGTALKDMLEDEAPVYDAKEPEEPLLPPGEYKPIADGVAAATVSELMEQFDARGIPIKVEAHGYAMRLSVRSEEVPVALGILAREGVLPEQPGGSDQAVAADGGPCPACGALVQPGARECPDCGLQLSSPAETCEKCGAELAEPDQACAGCGHRPG